MAICSGFAPIRAPNLPNQMAAASGPSARLYAPAPKKVWIPIDVKVSHCPIVAQVSPKVADGTMTLRCELLSSFYLPNEIATCLCSFTGSHF